MKRILCLWLPRLATDRLLRRPQANGAAPAPDASPADEAAKPFATVAAGQGGFRLTAVTAAAEAAGLSPGLLLADARALCPALRTEPADSFADAALLNRLARWCERYTPLVALDAPDGLFLDLSGCAHLFGGEHALACDLVTRLEAAGFSARAALTDTAGAAHAWVRFVASTVTVVPERCTRSALADLPVAALRIPPDQAARLTRLGLKTVGALYGLPRASLAARFGMTLVIRLDNALGHADEPLSYMAPVPHYRTRMTLPEPIVRQEDVLTAVERLAEALAEPLERDGQGLRRCVLTLFRVDGAVQKFEARASRPTRDAAHIARLFRERIARTEDEIDAGCGFETLILTAPETQCIAPTQTNLDPGAPASGDSETARLMDRLVNRIGFTNVMTALRHDSHIPEYALQYTPYLTAPPDRAPYTSPPAAARPFFLLPAAEPIEAMAEVPDGPPLWFRWRKVRFSVTRAEGPERIAAEWWRRPGRPQLTRDYFRVETEDGGRYWLYRLGLFGCESGDPRWYLHGLFG